MAESIGERIKALREERGWSLSALASTVLISKSYLHDLENGTAANPSAEILYNIAVALGTTVGYLLGRRANPLVLDPEETPPDIPASLEEFARDADVPDEDKRRLACIKYHGRQPKTKEDWAYLYETIKRVTRD